MTGIESLVMLIVYLVLFGLVLWAVHFVLAQMTLPQPVRVAVLVIVALLGLVWLFQTLGVI